MEEFIERCEKAISALESLAKKFDYLVDDRHRIFGKIEGLKLAISYAREMIPAPPPEPPPPPKQPKTG